MKVTFINRILNVGSNEWPRIMLGWLLHFFLRAGFVVGWTVTIAMFINRIGIEFLPYLFVLSALLVMLGTIIYSYLLKQIKHAPLIFYTTLMAGGLMLLGTLFAYSNDVAFLGIILIAQSILLSQLNILIALFTEDLFSPLESQRTFPLIATAETIGAIIGGLTVGVLAGFLPAYKFIYIWIIAILVIIPILLTSYNYSKKIPSLKISKSPKTTNNSFQNVVPNAIRNIRKIYKVPFFRGLIVIIALQFMILNLFEFQYTKAIQEEVVRSQPPISFEVRGYQPMDTNLEVSLLHVESVKPGQENHSTSQLETALSKKLGILLMIFSAGSLLVQILVASRIISSLGIVNSLLIHPLVTLINLVWMTLNFGFLSASIGRSNFEITGGIFKNAYLTSYYAMGETMRDQMKEILEGFVKPFGAILAFILYFLIHKFHTGNLETNVINVCLIGLALIMTFSLMRLQKGYTKLSHKNLAPENDLPTRLNAIEILAQKGHPLDTDILIHYLNRKKEPPQIKLKILKTLELIQDPKTISTILDHIKNSNPDIRLAALETLAHFKNLKTFLRQKAFTKYRMAQEIKTLFQNDESSKSRVACIQLLAKMDDGELIPFLVSTMTQGDERIKRACIRACGEFGDGNIIHYLEDYLNDKSVLVRAETIAALWQFTHLQKTLTHYLSQMKKGRKKETRQATLFTLGEIQEKKELPYLIQGLASTDQDIRQEAAKALAKLSHPAAIPHIAEFLMHENEELAQKTKQFIKKIPSPMIESVEQLVNLRVSKYIHDLLNKSGAESLMDLDLATLEKLKNAYATVDKHEEMHKIDRVIQQKTPSKDSKLIPNSNVLPA